MARYTATVHSPWPATKAFDYLADLRNFEEWDPGVSSSKQVTGEGPGLGARYEVEANGATLVYETETFDRPNELYVVARNRLIQSKDRITVASQTEKGVESGSAVTYDAELVLNGPLKIFDPIFSLVFDRIGSKAADGLRKALDAN